MLEPIIFGKQQFGVTTLNINHMRNQKGITNTM